MRNLELSNLLKILIEQDLPPNTSVRTDPEDIAIRITLVCSDGEELEYGVSYECDMSVTAAALAKGMRDIEQAMKEHDDAASGC